MDFERIAIGPWQMIFLLGMVLIPLGIATVVGLIVFFASRRNSSGSLDDVDEGDEFQKPQGGD